MNEQIDRLVRQPTKKCYNTQRLARFTLLLTHDPSFHCFTTPTNRHEYPHDDTWVAKISSCVEW